MTARVSRLVAALLVLLVASSDARAYRPGSQPGTLTVMSFNIRYGTARDGENHWSARRNLLFDVIREENADLVGVQEALDFQIDEILAAVPGYAAIGVGRDDAARAGEYAAILFRPERFRVAESGTFWFSDTPSVPGSRSWGNNVTRICTWARLIDRDRRGFWLFNVHLDHESQPSRERSTKLLRERIESRAFPREPVIVTGDFNVAEGNPAIATLTAATAGRPAPFLDTFRVLHAAETTVGTFTGFTSGRIAGDKIDYVLVEPGTEVLRAAIIRTSRNNRLPSDHFPVVAQIKLPGPPSQ